MRKLFLDRDYKETWIICCCRLLDFGLIRSGDKSSELKLEIVSTLEKGIEIEVLYCCFQLFLFMEQLRIMKFEAFLIAFRLIINEVSEISHALLPHVTALLEFYNTYNISLRIYSRFVNIT